MSEMLGNHYFMARKYPEALLELLPCFYDNPKNNFIKRKLIICYTQVGKINEAFDLFVDLVKGNITAITSIDPAKDDCPCPELVNNIEEFAIPETLDYYVLAGMLWLYCDPGHSLKYFETAERISPESKKIQDVILSIKSFIKSHQTVS